MSKNYTTMSLDSIKLLCGLIRDLASVSEGIDNLHLADDKTFSNIYIKDLVDKCLEDANTEAQKLVGALTHLTCEETTVQPTLDNSEVNVIYLYSADGNPPYQQYLKISNTKLVDLGSTSISLTDYIKAADVAKDYATKTELKAVTDKIGTTTLTTTAQTLTGSIEEVKEIAEQGALLTVTKTQYDQLVAGQTVNIGGKDYTYDDNTYYVVKDDGDTITTTSTINASSTDSEVPSAKAVYDKYNIHDLSEAYKNVIINPLLVDVNNPDTIYNKDGLVTRDTTEDISNFVIPSDCSWGIREIFWKSGGNLINKLTGMDLNNKPAEWVNVLSGTSTSYQWSGWQRVVTTKVADVPETVIRIDTLSSDEAKEGEIIYMVKDGICHMTITNLKVKNTNHILKMFPDNTIPKCAIRERWYVLTDTTDATNNILVSIRQEGSIGHYQVGNIDKVYSGSFSYPVAES